MSAQVDRDGEGQPGRRLSELALGVVLSAAFLLVGLAVVEGLLRLMPPVPDPYLQHKVEKIAQGNGYIRMSIPQNFRLRTTVDEGLPGMIGPNTFTTNNVGFRGDSLVQPKPPGELRVIMIGGSTTECLYIDDSVAINRIVERRLNQELLGRVKVYNAGVSGAAMADHISMLVHRVAHLEPDVVVVFAGINDLTRSIHGSDPLHFTSLDSLVQRRDLGAYLRFAASEFQLPRRLYYLLKPALPRTPTEILTEITDHSAYDEKVELARSAPEATELPRVDLESYRKNLRTLVGIARIHGIRLYLMTQQTSWNGPDSTVRQWHWMRYHDGVTYPEDVMDAALESLNDVMREVAAEFQVPLHDLAASLGKTSDFFYDDVHFNVRGAREAGEGLASTMLATRDHLLGVSAAGGP
jgi:lysophospholipase L1-like esterase